MYERERAQYMSEREKREQFSIHWFTPPKGHSARTWHIKTRSEEFHSHLLHGHRG